MAVPGPGYPIGALYSWNPPIIKSVPVKHFHHIIVNLLTFSFVGIHSHKTFSTSHYVSKTTLCAKRNAVVY